MQLPFLVVYLVVLVYAALRRKNLHQVSTLLIVSMATLIFGILVTIAFSAFPVLYQWIREPSNLGVVFGFGNLISGIISAAGWIFLIAAVYIARKTQQPAES
jgi:formate hydrogenlyase subunit 3/multisubunit Na+/H+ antiporter MnhD subunit